MVTKDFITIVLAGLAFFFSIASFILTFRQRAIEDQRNTRKALTDVIAELSKVSLAFNQLDFEHPGSTERSVVNFRRTYNGQRRYLANHGEFLAEQIPSLTTDVDCVTLASAFDSAGDFVRAQKYFELSVNKSPTNIIRVWNLRGLARFWFNQGNAPRGRKIYEESLQLTLPDIDRVRQSVADTYLLWAAIEEEHGYTKEAQRVRELGLDAAKRIGHTPMREGMIKQLSGATPASDASKIA
jgi:tetratricopeptide (TPR) repeat protein